MNRPISSVRISTVALQSGSPLGSGPEWRLNERLLEITQRQYWDLYRNNEYEHVWIAHSPKENKWHIGSATAGTSLGEFDSFEQAEEHLVVLSVIERFKGAER